MLTSHSNTLYLMLSILAMAGVTLLTRVTPLILPKKYLNAPLLLTINKGLPLAVMTLLILTSLQWHDNISKQLYISPLLVSQLLALIVVLFSYHVWKQLFISMIIGIASVNLFLWIFKVFSSI